MKTVRQVAGVGRHGIHPREPKAPQRAASDLHEIVHRTGWYLPQEPLTFAAKGDGAASPPRSPDPLTMEALDLLINDVFVKEIEGRFRTTARRRARAMIVLPPRRRALACCCLHIHGLIQADPHHLRIAKFVGTVVAAFVYGSAMVDCAPRSICGPSPTVAIAGARLSALRQ